MHDRLIELRDTVHAHTDRTAERQAVNVTRMFGLGGNLFKQQRTLVPDEWLPTIAELADHQWRRLQYQVHLRQRELPDAGPVPVPLFYRTSKVEADAILAGGFTDVVVGTLSNGEPLIGVRLRDDRGEPDGTADRGAVLFLQIPADRLRPYELLPLDGSSRIEEWIVPAKILNEYGAPVVVPG